jgi:DNA polymerase III alpha subunit
MTLYSIDEYGRAVVDSRGLFELWYQGLDEHGLSISMDEEITRFNSECTAHGKTDILIQPDGTIPLTHSERAKRWLIPEEYKSLDVEAYCLSLCTSEEERLRVRHEMGLFHFYGMEPVLQSLIYMVKVFREQKIVWGIGRGSSVASYVLFLIGVHKINSMAFGLDVEDFLR